MFNNNGGPPDGLVLILLAATLAVAAAKASADVTGYVCLGIVAWILIRQSRL